MELQCHQHRVDWENASVLKQEHGYWKRRGTDDFTGHRSQVCGSRYRGNTLYSSRTDTRYTCLITE